MTPAEALAELARLEKSVNLNWAFFDHYRAVALAQQNTIDEQVKLIRLLIAHLNYCGWGDSWERECSEELQKIAENWQAENPKPPEVPK